METIVLFQGIAIWECPPPILMILCEFLLGTLDARHYLVSGFIYRTVIPGMPYLAILVFPCNSLLDIQNANHYLVLRTMDLVGIPGNYHLFMPFILRCLE